MCGRFTLSNPEKIKERFSAKLKGTLLHPSFNVAPGQNILTLVENNGEMIKQMSWGLKYKADDKYGSINIREETTKEKPYFQHILAERRCLIPADGFYEWKTLNLEGKAEKYPFYFYLNDRDLFAFAGIYNSFRDAEDKPLLSCAILTCSPNDEVSRIHNRMPVILRKEDENSWLDASNKDLNVLYEMLKPYQGKITFHAVGKEVNNPVNDNKELIKRVYL